MQETIEDFFTKNYTPEMNAVLDKFFSLLERLNITTHEFYLANKLADLDNFTVSPLGEKIAISYLKSINFLK